MIARGWLLLGTLQVLLACGARSAPSRPVASEFVEVDYPPPPAEVEETEPELPGRPECVWVAGSHTWQGRRWQWTPGEWVVPPPGCSRAEIALGWSRDEPPRLYYTPAHWYRTAAPAATAATTPCPPAIPCLNRPRTPR
jgi:hypothetical protein